MTTKKARQPKRSNTELAIEKSNSAGQTIQKAISRLEKASKNVKLSGDDEVREQFNKMLNHFSKKLISLEIINFELSKDTSKAEFNMMDIVEID